MKGESAPSTSASQPLPKSSSPPPPPPTKPKVSCYLLVIFFGVKLLLVSSMFLFILKQFKALSFHVIKHFRFKNNFFINYLAYVH